MDMAATQTMPYEKLYAKGKEVTFEPDFYYSQVTTAEQISLLVHAYHINDRQDIIQVIFSI